MAISSLREACQPPAPGAAGRLRNGRSAAGRPLLLLLVALAACDPYSPDLGDSPFRCGENNACPGGYQCVAYSQTDRVCEKSSGNPDDPDGGSNVVCNDDSSIETNDAPNDAHILPIPSMEDVRMVQLAVCPTGDQDYYRFGVNENGKNIHVTLTTEVSDGLLALQILGATTSPTTIEVPVNNLSIGDYYVRVAAHPDEPSAQNNYTLDVLTCGPAGGPCSP
jgi:hypothetical protein